MVDPQHGQAVAGPGQQVFPAQRPYPAPLAAEPDQLRLQAQARGLVEVGAGLPERQSQFRRHRLPCQIVDQAEIEGRIGQGVGHRGPRRHHPVFDADVGPAVIAETHQRPVPAPDGAVVQPQVGQFRLRLVHQLGQQYRVVFQIDPETVGDGVDVTTPQGHPLLIRVQTHLDRLFEQADPALRPQVGAEKIGGVGTHRHHGRGQDLGGIVEAAGLRRIHLEMDLERGGGGFQHHPLMDEAELIPAMQVDVQFGVAAQLCQLLVQRRVALHRGHVGGSEVLQPQGRQDADHHQMGGQVPRQPLAFVPGRRQLVCQAGQGVPVQGLGRTIDLQVETGQLRHHQGIPQAVQQGLVDRRRTHLLVHQPGLELEATHLFVTGQTTALQPLLQQSGLAGEALAELLEVVRSELGTGNLLSHGPLL